MRSISIYFIQLLTLFSTLTLLTACGVTKVPSGNEAVLIKKPIFFGESGVEQVAYPTGRHFYALTTDAEVISIRPYQITENFDDLITKDNNPVDFNVYISVEHISGKTWLLVEKYGSNWYVNNVKEPLRTMVRNYAKQKEVFELTTNPEVLTWLETNIYRDIKAFIKTNNLPINVLKLTVGKITPPREVIEETVRTAIQKQRKNTEIQRSKAEESRELAEKAKASADKAYRDEFKLSNKEYLQLRTIENERYKLDIAKEKKDLTMIFSDIPVLLGK